MSKLSKKVLAEEMRILTGHYNSPSAEACDLAKEVESLERKLAALYDQIENEGCVASHLGERTYQCRADKPCGLCRLRGERDKLQRSKNK